MVESEINNIFASGDVTKLFLVYFRNIFINIIHILWFRNNNKRWLWMILNNECHVWITYVPLNFVTNTHTHTHKNSNNLNMLWYFLILRVSFVSGKDTLCYFNKNDALPALKCAWLTYFWSGSSLHVVMLSLL